MRYRLRRAVLLLMTIAMILLPGTGMAEKVPLGVLDVDGYQIVFADVMSEEINWQVDEKTPQADLNFFLRLSRKVNAPLFTMTMMVDQGDYVAILTGPNEEFVPVGFTLAEPPRGLNAKEQQTYDFARQEVYVLLATMELLAMPGETEVPDDTQAVVTVETELLTMSYLARWSGQLETAEQDGGLVFRALINGKKYTVFTVKTNAEGGDIMLNLKDENGEPVPVAILLADVPSGLSGDARDTFHLLRDVVDEVIGSLALR